MELNNNIELAIEQRVKDAVKDLFGQEPETGQVQVQKTRKDFKGDFTIVVFPLLKISRKKPEETGTLLGNYLQKEVQEVQSFNVVKGFLNLELKNSYWEILFRNIYI